MIVLLGPCVVTMGCAQAFGPNKHDVLPVAQSRESVEVPQASPNRPQADTRWTGQAERPVVRNLPACPVGTAVAADEGAAPALANRSGPVLPAAYLDNAPTPSPGQHRPSRDDEGLAEFVNNSPAPQPEMVPPPQAVPAEKPIAAGQPLAVRNGGPLITLHVANQDVRQALEMISRQANMNILVSPGVNGTVALDLREKSLDETLRLIAKMCHLAVRREKDVIYISTVAELREDEENDLPVRVYHLNYVKSTDMEMLIKKVLSSKGTITSSPDSEVGLASDVASAGGGGGASGGGGGGGASTAVKAGGNSLAGGEVLVVQDYENVLKKVDSIVAQIDVQPIQVLIEAVIVQVKLDKSMELGVNFAMLDQAGNALGVIGNGAAISGATGFAPASVLAAGGKLAGGFSANTSGIKFGWVGGDTSTFLRALEKVAETKVLACPRLQVLNKQRAEIHIGDQLGYKTSTQTQTSTVETVNYMNVGTQLRLRPFVSSDGMVRLEIHPERSIGALDAEGIPQTNTSQVTTNIMVPDGTTIVIGGLIDSEVDRARAGVPFLSRLPWLGFLFGESTNDVKKRELVIILTPHILRPEAPEALNCLGRPNALGLDKRVSQRPHGDALDGPNLFELTGPHDVCPQDEPPPPEFSPTLTGRAAAGFRQRPM